MRKKKVKLKDQFQPMPRRNLSEWYSVIEAFYLCGSIRGAERMTGVSNPAIVQHRKRNPEMWEAHLEKLREQTRAEHLAGFREIIEKAMAETIDRLENGNEVVDARSGERHRVKVNAREAATIAGIFTDKARVAQGQPTSISARASTPGNALERLKKQALDLAGAPKDSDKADDTDVDTVH